MATTAQEVFGIAMDLIDERLDTGLLSESDTVSYKVKTPGLLTILQSELIKQGDLFKTYEIANKPITNLLGYTSELDIMEFTGTEFIRECIGSAKAYYFEVDRVGTVYVEDYNGAWNTLATITTTNTPNGFTAYKGVVTPSSGATKSRLRFTGSYYYKTINRALFDIPFALAADVPDYRPWVKKQMPNDFKSVNEIVEEFPNRQYANPANYKWEGKRDLYMNYYFEGNIRVVYRPIPSIVAAMTDTLQVDDVTARTIIPYGLGAHLLLTENADVAGFLQQRYEELKAEASKSPPTASETINNVYGGFS
ncbi:hypothetical protein BK133_00795 [Paenibacillus sp. FSL H8-0548]|uniref:hypothetical protein n=1 Tax=Paenibacillus sp. FSL H8-0548 TaxID=1920422 RepID=UPI00096E5BE2|nr:hypothetical protein [Paenibacillus sp. FSL H8-0548]OMF38774.1 hypothetical protein BK133_00795 [Paenibacillus sp. FSL H8-0548]